MKRKSETPRSATSVDIEIGRRIYEQRKRARLTQSQLAETAGVSFQQLQKYERGLNRVSVGRLAQFAHVLRVPLSIFYEGLIAPAAASGAFRNNDGNDEFEEFIQTPEGHEIYKLFRRIKRPKARRLLLELVRRLQKE